MIERVFVLVLENRSFDHMLGFSGITGTDAKTGAVRQINGLSPSSWYNYPDPHKPPDPLANPKVFAKTPADFALGWRGKDPGHEFGHTLDQLCGPNAAYSPGKGFPPINNSGFVWQYEQMKAGNISRRKVMDCFEPTQLPVLNALANEYAVCDAWYSSMPGPTFPNRFFFHAGSSAGLDHSPKWYEIVKRMKSPYGWGFQNGTIFDWLDNESLEWRIYEGDRLPHSGSIKGANTRIHRFFRYSKDLFIEQLQADNFLPQYVFIEPNYGHYILPGDFSGGTSQHPRDDVREGERLIKEVYEAIRDSRYWEQSLLLITYDEHGGFGDHVSPPTAVPPGDKQEQGNNITGFDFRQYGVRVPAVIVSPWIPRGIIDGTRYDHASLLKTLTEVFPGIKGKDSSTTRIKAANSFLSLCSLAAPRTDRPEIPDPPFGLPEGELRDNIPPDLEDQPISPEVAGFIFVAYLRDREVLRPLNLLEDEQLFEQMIATNTMGAASRYVQQVSEAMNRYYTEREGLPM